MKAELDCIPCFLKQSIKATRFAKFDPEIQEKILREVIFFLSKTDWNKTPPELAHFVHRLIRNYDEDPFKEIKKQSNDVCLEIYPELKKIVETSNNPLKTGLKIAISGNLIDFGALDKEVIDKKYLLNFVKRIVNEELDVDHFEKFESILNNSIKILYFADNSGEIVFDKIFIEELKKNFDLDVTFVVKAGPIINDATIEDVKYVGLDKVVDEIRFISNGEKGVERNSEEVLDWIKEHDIVISKGQGNYEGLSEFSGIFYALLVKCNVVAKHLSVPIKSKIFIYR